MFIYQTRGTCSTAIELEIRDGIITHCKFINGCKGNTQGVAKLAMGQPAEKVAELLAGTQCRGGTSCPDQLAKAIRAYHD